MSIEVNAYNQSDILFSNDCNINYVSNREVESGIRYPTVATQPMSMYRSSDNLISVSNYISSKFKRDYSEITDAV